MGKRDDKKARKLAALLRAGLAEFLTRGYADASLERIVKDVDIARGTFYLYFASKLELYRAVVGPFLADLEGRLAGAAALDDVADAFSRAGKTHPQAALVVLQDLRSPGEGGAFLRDHEAAWIAVTLRAREAGTRRAAVAFVGMVERALVDELAGEASSVLEGVDALRAVKAASKG